MAKSIMEQNIMIQNIVAQKNDKQDLISFSLRSKMLGSFAIAFIFLFLLLVFFSIDLLAFDFGCGGIFWGANSSFFPSVPKSFVNFSYFGGYGYANISGTIFGGFGLAILSNEKYFTGGDLAGGFGGLITGIQFIDTYSVNLLLLVWLGLGGISVDSTDGYFAGYIEITMELGIQINSFTELILYAGYQIMGNLISGRPFYDFFNQTVVIGVRLAFGS